MALVAQLKSQVIPLFTHTNEQSMQAHECTNPGTFSNYVYYYEFVVAAGLVGMCIHIWHTNQKIEGIDVKAWKRKQRRNFHRGKNNVQVYLTGLYLLLGLEPQRKYTSVANTQILLPSELCSYNGFDIRTSDIWAFM